MSALVGWLQISPTCNICSTNKPDALTVGKSFLWQHQHAVVSVTASDLILPQALAIVFYPSQQKGGRRTEEGCALIARTFPKSYPWYFCLYPTNWNLVTCPQLPARAVFISVGQVASWKSGVLLQRKKWRIYLGRCRWYGREVFDMESLALQNQRSLSELRLPTPLFLSIEWWSPGQCHLEVQEWAMWVKTMAAEVRQPWDQIHLWISSFPSYMKQGKQYPSNRLPWVLYSWEIPGTKLLPKSGAFYYYYSHGKTHIT